MRVADERHPLALISQRRACSMAMKVLPLPAPAHLDPGEQFGGLQDDGLALGEDVGGILVLQRTGDDVTLGWGRGAERDLKLLNSSGSERRTADLLIEENVAEPPGEGGQIIAVDDLPARAPGSANWCCGTWLLGRTTMWSQRRRPQVQRGSASMKLRSA